MTMYIPLHNIPQYEILNRYPFTIRNRNTYRVMGEFYDGDGYPQVCLNGKTYRKHRLIAQQFIPNDDPSKTLVDHINRDRSDYHLENLRWITPSDNRSNASANNGFEYQYLDCLPSNPLPVTHFGNHRFRNLYYHNHTFYSHNGVQYRALRVSRDKHGYRYVSFNDVNGVNVKILYYAFMVEYDLV